MKWNRIIGVILLSLALIVMVISLWPVSVFSSLINFAIPDDLSGTLELIQPNQVHVGDEAEISLKFIFDQDSVDSDFLTLFSKLELSNLEVTPRGEGEVTIDPSKPLVLKWKITPQKSGIYSGTLWLFAESNKGDRNLVLARPIKLEAKSLFGFSYRSARIVCLIVLITGIFVLFYPIIIKKNAWLSA